MKRIIGTTLLVFVGVGALVASSAVTPQSVSRPMTRTASTAPLVEKDVEESIRYLTEGYSISRTEALRRLTLQHKIPVIRARLLDEAADTYAGLAIDQAAGGRLVVKSSEPDNIRGNTLLPELDTHDPVVIEKTRWSLRQLSDTATQAQQELPTLGDFPHKVIVSEQDNIVSVRVNEDLPEPTTHTIEAYLSRYDGKAVLTRDNPRTAPEDPAPDQHEKKQDSTLGYIEECPIGNCLPPLMGGHRLDVTRKDPKGETQWGGCSVGFNIKAEKTGQPFVLTAGHCVIGDNHPDDFADKAYHNGIPVAQKEGSIRKIQKGDSGTQESVDYAFLPYQVDGETNWGDYWINRRPKKNAIFIRCEAGAKPCDPHVTYIEGIGQFNNVTEGTVLCHSGSANDETNKGTENANYRPGTRCGAVKGKGGQVDRVFVMDICSRPGDSGGPLFSQTDRLAYGLLRGWIKGLTNECKVSHEKDKTDFTVLEFTLADAEKESGQTLGLRVFNSRDNT